MKTIKVNLLGFIIFITFSLIRPVDDMYSYFVGLLVGTVMQYYNLIDFSKDGSKDE